LHTTYSLIQIDSTRTSKIDFVVTSTFITLQKLYKFFYSSLILNNNAWWINQILIHMYVLKLYEQFQHYLNQWSQFCIQRQNHILIKKIMFTYSLIHINFKQHFLNFKKKKLYKHYLLVFKLLKMKVVINHNQICTWISMQKRINKNSWYIRHVLKHIWLINY